MKGGKTFYIIFAIIFILISILFLNNSFSKNIKLDEVALKNIENDNANLAIMIWDDEEEDYVKYTGNTTFPNRSEYVYVKDESGCTNISDQKVPNSLIYDAKNSRATVTTKETVKCFLYFKEGLSLTINKGEGIDKIYFKVNNMEEYEESNSNVTLKVLPNSSYSYYGTTIDNTYVLNECIQSSLCTKTMGDIEKVETIGAIKQIYLTITKDSKIETIKYKKDGESTYSTYSTPIPVEANTKYYYYGEVGSTYSSDYLSLCTQSSPCSVNIGQSNTTANVGVIIKPQTGTLARYIADLADVSGTNVITQTTASTDQTGDNATTDYRYIGNDICEYDNKKGIYITNSDGSCSKLYNYTRTKESDKTTTEYTYQTSVPSNTYAYTYTKTAEFEGTPVYNGPKNYVKLEHTGGTYELYRIIGVFNTAKISGSEGSYTASTTEYEWRVKLIKAESYGNRAWSGSNSNESNNYNNSTLLNSSGELNTTYWNTLSSTTQGLIDPVVWHLGGVASTSGDTSVPTFFNKERSNSAQYGDNPKSAINKIGLMYPSDYGYATNGGILGRAICLDSSHKLYNWSRYSECYKNSWLFLGSDEWTLSHRSGASYLAWRVSSSGLVNDYAVDPSTVVVRPVLYLKSNTKLKGTHTGSSSDPYEVEL